MPGISDGHALETDLIANLKYYQDLVNAYSAHQMSVDKRGGPYFPSKQQLYVLGTYIGMTMVKPHEFAAGTGHLLLFDLKGNHGNIV